MTLRQINLPQFKPARDATFEWNDFSGGWNKLFRPTELKGNELAQADNLMLTGRGTPTGRWGSQAYFLAGSGRIRLLDAYYNSSTSTNYVLAVTDMGYMVRKSGASYTIITGASFTSGSVLQSVELGGSTYIAANDRNFIRFNGTQLIPYAGLSTPTNVSLAQLSAATGFNTYSWVITATSVSGETLSSVAKSLTSLPLDLTQTAIRVTWNTVSSAPSVLTGYNLYRGTPGNERYLASVGSGTTQYIDTGQAASSTVFPPNSDTTAGPKAKYILKFNDRIVLAGLQGDPSKVLISGRYPYNDRFTAIDGGGYAYVSPDDGEDIKGLGTATIGSTPLIVVYKENSTHIISLSTVTLGNFVILDPQVYVLSTTSGASSADTAIQVENDMFAFGRKGLYSTGQEAQFLNQLRNNEISSRIRNYVQSLSDNDFKEACGAYIDYKYILSFPSRQETIIYDRQRTAFMGPWSTPFGITKWYKYLDDAGTERWLAGCDDGYVREFSSSLITDSGTAIAKTLRTKKEQITTWSTIKILKYIYFLMRNVRGTVTVNLLLESRDGSTTVTKSASITSTLGSSGFGNDQFGQQQFGQTDATVVLTGEELVRYSQIFKQFRVLQFEVVTTAANSNFELLGFKATAQDFGPNSLPASTRI